MDRRLRLVPVLFTVLVVSGCDLMQSSGKGGVETTNGVSGLIKDPSGNPVAHAQVLLVPEAYDGAAPGQTTAPERTETDAQGRYRFDRVTPGTYNLESQVPGRNVKAWMPGLAMGTGQKGETLADAVLKAPGVLKIPFADRHLSENAVLFIPGSTMATSIVGKIDAHGDLTLPGLPEGRFPSLMAYFPDTSDGGAAEVCPAFTIRSGDTTRMTGLEAWSGRKSLGLDFSGAGGISEPMAGHPILIRLDAADLDFSAAGAGGKDVRFTDAAGTGLPFQIERWDAAAKEAAIWVRLTASPGVPPAGGKKDSLIVYWGRKDAIEVSDGAAVFDSAQGFAAVWHLGEAGNAVAGGYKDATAGRYHATGAGTAGDPGLQAVAGNGRLFQDSGHGLTAPMPASLKGGTSFSVTFWMDFKPNPRRQTILSLGEELTDLGFHFLIRPDTSAQFGPFNLAGPETPSPKQNSFSLSPYADRWVFVATVYDAPKGTLTTYVNGVEAAASSVPAFAMGGSGGVKIGAAIQDARDAQSDFSGALDEVRLYGKAMDGKSIRLEYSIQRKDSSIVLK
ncbi:MAG: hypothetical protein JWP91_4712 [Fibrobacteres bacterium]|nr:hypothetical protein [Fibrobacterota bacterium]